MPSPLGRPIRVGVFEHNPDAFNCFRIMPSGNCSKPGAEMEIISIVMEMLDWEWEVIDTHKEYNVNNDFGNPMPDGNFSGIMGLLADDTIDMGGLSMRITPERMKVAHFTFPIRYFQQVYIIKRPPENDFRNFIFASFRTNMWVTLMASILAVAIVRTIIGSVVNRKAESKINLFFYSLLEAFGIMLKQRIADAKGAAMRILEISLILAMMFVTQYYGTSMNSKLTAPSTTHVPFLHQEQLIDLFESHQRYPTYYFDLELEGSNTRNEERLEKYWKKNRLRTHDTEDQLIAEIQRGGVFYSTYDIEFLPQPVSIWDRRQGLTVIRDTTGIISYVAFGFSISNRKICHIFNKALMNILPGISKITLAPGYAYKKSPEDSVVQAKRTTLSFKKHLEQLFLIFIIGMGICVVVFLIELLIGYWSLRRKSKMYHVERNFSVETVESYVRTEE